MEKKHRLSEFKKGMGPTIRELRFMMGRIVENSLSILGLTILLFFVLVAVLAPVLAPPKGPDPYTIPRESKYEEPSGISAAHPFGTTQNQYDIYYGTVWGTRTAFRIGIMVVGASIIVSLIVGCIAGYYGGVIDELVMRFTDIIIAFPGLILAMSLVIALGRGLDTVMFALILVGWPGYARVIRAEVLRVKNEDYVEAAKAVGCSDLRVITRHILPNSIYPIVIMASLDIGAIVLAAAALSFLGIGAPEGYADWGQMVSLSQGWITNTKYWYTFTIPGLFIAVFVLAWNLLGDAFRDILDPTVRRR